MAEQTYIAGTQFITGAREALLDLPKGCRLELKREPGNRHDKNAVGVWHRGTHLGYLPRDHVATIAPRLDSGEAAGCVLQGGKSVLINWENGNG